MTLPGASKETSGGRDLETEQLTSRECAQRILDCATSAIEARGRFVVIAAGGLTPRNVYQQVELLGGQQDADWNRWTVLLSDERCLPFGHEGRNDRMLGDSLPSLAIAGRIHPILVKGDVAVAAASYETTIQRVEPVDLAVLGLGADGHTASLFPSMMEGPDLHGTVRDQQRLCIVVSGTPGPAAERISLNASVLSRARQVWFLVDGADRGKDWAVRELNQGRAIPANEVRASLRRLILLRAAEGPGVER